MIDAVHFTSAKTETGSDVYKTPRELFDFLNAELGPFTIDAAADASNALCTAYFDEAADGLVQVWTGRVWCNPPYSQLNKWLTKGFNAVHVDGSAERVVMLIPARTDTVAFQAFAARATVFFLKGRLVFGRSDEELMTAAVKWFEKNAKAISAAGLAAKIEELRKQPAPFPSAVLVFDRTLPASVHFVDWRAA